MELSRNLFEHLHKVKKNLENHICVVRGNKNFSRDNLIKLTPEESVKIKTILSKVVYDPNGGEEYLNKIRSLSIDVFPKRLLDLIYEQKKAINIKPYIVITGLPFDNVTGSPKDGEIGDNYKKTFLSENINIALSLLLGEPYSIEFEGKQIVNNLVPHKTHSREYTGLGYDAELDFHIENAALKHTNNYVSPMGLILQGVRHDRKAPITKISDAYLALEKLSKEDISELQGNNFSIKVPYRWRGKFPNEISDISILSNHKTPDVSAAFYFDMIEAKTEKSKTALKNLEDAVNQVGFGVDIRPGTLVYIDNRRAMHAREAFHATFDANDYANRWIQRTFIAPSLWEFRDFMQKGERIFKPS